MLLSSNKCCFAQKFQGSIIAITSEINCLKMTSLRSAYTHLKSCANVKFISDSSCRANFSTKPVLSIIIRETSRENIRTSL